MDVIIYLKEKKRKKGVPSRPVYNGSLVSQVWKNKKKDFFFLSFWVVDNGRRKQGVTVGGNRSNS